MNNADISIIRDYLKIGNLHFKLNLFEFFLNPTNDSKVFTIIKNKLSINEKEFKDLINYSHILNHRLLTILNYAKEKNCLIMVDAEQTYLQIFIDYIVAHYFKIFNKEICLLENTIQCYLKDGNYKLSKWYLFCRNNNLKLGIKLVRGAYISEENDIAHKNGYPSPICSSIEETHHNYNQSIKFLFDNYIEGDKVLIN